MKAIFLFDIPNLLYVQEEEPPPTSPDQEDTEPQPPKEEIHIVELSGAKKPQEEKACKVCGKTKPAYVEMESQGVTEYICKECYDKTAKTAKKECRGCGAALSPDDTFCGKCGKPTVKKCSECDTKAKDEDLFCGKCGTKL